MRQSVDKIAVLSFFRKTREHGLTVKKIRKSSLGPASRNKIPYCPKFFFFRKEH